MKNRRWRCGFEGSRRALRGNAGRFLRRKPDLRWTTRQTLPSGCTRRQRRYDALCLQRLAVNQSFPQTATGEYLDYHAALRGITRKAGTKARGSLRFRLDAAREDDLTIKCGTSARRAGLVRFVTTADGIIAAGELYADIPAEAESVGTSGNAGAETIAVMTRAPEGVSGVLNPKAFTGGSGAETDEELRARVLDSFIRLPNGANAAFYELRALSHAGVEAAVVIPRMNGIGTVGVVIAAPEACRRRSFCSRCRTIWTRCARSQWM